MSESPLSQAIRADIPDKSIILYGILHWGLGHASRSLPIIDALRNAGHTVFVVCEHETYQWLKKERPHETFFMIPNSGFQHTGSHLLLNILKNIWPMIRLIFFNQLHIPKLLNKTGANVIISDNRFHFYSKKTVVNIYITHQMVIHHHSKFVSYVLTKAHQFFIRYFQKCWIFDDENKRLAGKLSTRTSPLKQKYIGLHSRLKILEKSHKSTDVLFLISGPEPQRSIFENSIIFWCNNHPHLQCCVIRGNTKNHNEVSDSPHFKIIHLADTHTLTEEIETTKSIVCRPGYSTLMDLSPLIIPVLLIPTPGQTEQEYLSINCVKEFTHFTTVAQKDWEKEMPSFLTKIEQSHLVNP